MKTIVLTAAMLALAGCSNRDGDDAGATYAAPRPPIGSGAEANGSVAVTPEAAGGASDTRATPHPGTPVTFGDWSVGCDNVATCTMESLGSEGTDFPKVTMRIVRAAGPAGGYRIDFDQPAAPAGETATPISLTIDGRLMQVIANDGPSAAQLVAAVTHAHAMILATAAGTAAISPDGAAAAVRYIDAAQGRAGGVTATVATGSAPAAAVPAAKPVPTIVAIAPDGAAAQPTGAQRDAMMRMADCDTGLADRDPKIFGAKAYALGNGRTLVLLPCQVGAYNLSSAMFVLGGGPLRPVLVDAPSGFAATPAGGGRVPGIVGGEWHDGILSGEALGRGLGDCGVRQRYVWDGARLRLSMQSEMRECRGNPRFIPMWRTDVVRG